VSKMDRSEIQRLPTLLAILTVIVSALVIAAIGVGAGLFLTPSHFWFGTIGAVAIMVGPGLVLFFFPASRKRAMTIVPPPAKKATAPNS
jgi:hypothetical protein